MSRRGFSLAELLVVMAMMSVVFAVAVGMVHRVMHEQKRADRDNAMHRVAERLSTKLREDVHSAERAELVQSDEGQKRLNLTQRNDTTVSYVVRTNVVERTATRENETVHRDSYRFPENYRLEVFDNSAQQVSFTAFVLPQAYLTTLSDQSPGVVRESEVPESQVRRAVMHVEASAGRDHRFLHETAEAE